MPFFRLPSVVAFEGDGYARCDAVLLGVPWDGAVTGQGGAKFAPFHVRRTSAFIQGYHVEHRVSVFESLRVADGGNMVFPPFAADVVREVIQSEVQAVLDANAVPVLLGGDHSITLPSLRATAAKHGPVAVVHIDAHLDTSDDAIWGDPYHHGTPLRHALSEGLVESGQLYQIGVRGSWSSEDDGAFGDRYRAQRYPMDVLDDRGVAAIGQEVRARIGDRPTYITFDIDGVDPAFAPGTGTPVPGGLTAREALRLLRSLAGLSVVGADVVEVCPATDVGDATCALAAQLLFEQLALIAIARRREG
jgi:agmatinase